MRGRTKETVEQAKTFFGSAYLQNANVEKWRTLDAVSAAIKIQGPRGSPDDPKVRSDSVMSLWRPLLIGLWSFWAV